MHLYLPRAGRRAAACFAALAALAACDSSSGPRPQVAARLDIVAGNEQEAVVGSELPTALVVKVTDDRGRPVRGQIVNFRVVSGGGGVFAGTAQTNDAGEARERWTLGTSTAAADSQRVEVRAVDAASGEALVFATFRATAKPDVPAGAPPVGPASRTGAAGTVLADSLALRVADKYGNPVPGIDVAWAVASGGGSVSPATSRTDASGVAKARWTLGGATGTQTATGTAAGLPATTFIATVNVGAVARVTIMPRDLRFATLGRQIQKALRDDLAERNHDERVRGERPHRIREGLAAHTLRLVNGVAQRERPLLDRRHLHLLAAPLGAVRLRYHTQNPVARRGVMERLQGGDGKRRGAKKQNAHAQAVTATPPGRRRLRDRPLPCAASSGPRGR